MPDRLREVARRFRFRLDSAWLVLGGALTGLVARRFAS
jgi:hypothetical protein